ncbi:MAG: hypothetical protein KDD99_33270, partial [Bacteroidetes bacterium]|nr:hypothetical protein [Bacteroidota bacterium]
SYNEDLRKLSKKRKSKNVLFFSRVRKGIFFVEITHFGKKQGKKVKPHHQGISYVFMFHIDDSAKVNPISSIQIRNN